MLHKDDNKPFVKISTPLLESITNRNILSGTEFQMWMIIYTINQRHRHKNGTPIAYTALERRCGLSYITVCRTVASLLKKGFLDVTPVHKEKWGINILQCIVPDHVQDKIDRTPNRFMWEEGHESIPNQEEKHPTKPLIDVSVSMDPGDNLIPNQEKNLPIIKNDIHNKKNIIIYNNIHNVARDCESFDSGEGKALRAEIICKERELSKLEEALSFAKDKFLEAYHLPETDSKITFALLQQKNLAVSRVEFMENSIKYLQKKLDDGIAMSKIREKVKLAEGVVNDIPGERMISRGLLWWIKKKLFSFGVDPGSIPRILNEMVHSIRFGSFSVVKYSPSREPMPLMRSVNCCLKLIREGKWQSPSSYQDGAIYA